MKVKLANDRNLPCGEAFKGKDWPKWSFGYMAGDDEMVFLENPIRWTESTDFAQKYDTDKCFPYAGCMLPGFGVYGSGFSRMGVLFYDRDGKPTIFLVRHFKPSKGGNWDVDYDEVYDIEAA